MSQRAKGNRWLLAAMSFIIICFGAAFIALYAAGVFEAREADGSTIPAIVRRSPTPIHTKVSGKCLWNNGCKFA